MGLQYADEQGRWGRIPGLLRGRTSLRGPECRLPERGSEASERLRSWAGLAWAELGAWKFVGPLHPETLGDFTLGQPRQAKRHCKQSRKSLAYRGECKEQSPKAQSVTTIDVLKEITVEFEGLACTCRG